MGCLIFCGIRVNEIIVIDVCRFYMYGMRFGLGGGGEILIVRGIDFVV